MGISKYFYINNHINSKFKNKIMVQNKSDLEKEKNSIKGAVSISALKGVGLGRLLKKIQKVLLKTIDYSGDSIINTQRQSDSISDCLSFIDSSITLLKENPPHFELVAQAQRDADKCLDLFLGKSTSDDILDSVFSSFCVGK